MKRRRLRWPLERPVRVRLESGRRASCSGQPGAQARGGSTSVPRAGDHEDRGTVACSQSFLEPAPFSPRPDPAQQPSDPTQAKGSPCELCSLHVTELCSPTGHSQNGDNHDMNHADPHPPARGPELLDFLAAGNPAPRTAILRAACHDSKCSRPFLMPHLPPAGLGWAGQRCWAALLP